MTSFIRPTPNEWLAVWPQLKENGNYLEGPCPACGDLAKVEFRPFLRVGPGPHIFGIAGSVQKGIRWPR